MKGLNARTRFVQLRMPYDEIHLTGTCVSAPKKNRNAQLVDQVALAFELCSGFREMQDTDESSCAVNNSINQTL